MTKTAALLLAVAWNVANAEGPKPTTLQCLGKQTSTGIHAPKDAYIPASNTVHGIYTIDGAVLIESGDGEVADGRYSLCSTTSTNYIYSTDCNARRGEYIADWLRTTNFDPDSPFYKKYPGISSSFDTINIDRVNLTVDE